MPINNYDKEFYQNQTNVRDINTIILHDTGMEEHEQPYPYPERGDWIKAIKEDFKKRKIKGYHYLIDREGAVHEINPMEVRGEHAKGRNVGSIGVSLMGRKNFTGEQITAMQGVVRQLRNVMPQLKIEKHYPRDIDIELEPLFPEYFKGDKNAL